MDLETNRTFAEYSEMINKVFSLVAAVNALDNETRSEFVAELRSKICIYCGSNSLPCYCMCDD